MLKFIEKEKIKIDEEFKIRTEANKSLANSIRKFGIIQPLIVSENNLLIDGFSRFELTEEKTVPAIREKDLKKAFIKSITVNMANNPYSEMEKAKAVKIAFEKLKMDKEEIVKELNPILKFSKKISVVNDCISVFSLNPKLLKLLQKKKAPLSFALYLLKETEKEQIFLADFFEQKKLSLSIMIKTYDLLYYIRKRENKKFSEIVNQCEKEENILNCLEEKRFPKYFALKKEIEKALKNYSPYIQFQKDFESSSFFLSAKLKTENDAKKLSELLDKASKDKELWKALKKVTGND